MPKPPTNRIAITLTAIVMLAFAACASAPQVGPTMVVPDSADVPYDNVLVLALFSKFDTRRYLEDEIASRLEAQGVKAVTSTSMMTSKTPLTRQFIVETMTELGSDSLLLTQLADLHTAGKVKNMSPEGTYNVRPTYYVNVYSVEQTEYIEPVDVQFTHELSTSSDLYSASQQEKVWGIITHSRIKENVDHMRDYSIIVREAEAIAGSLLSEGIVGP